MLLLLELVECSRRCPKYRRGAGEIVVVTHEGGGWWDPNSDAKGDAFGHLEPRLNFGEVREVRKVLRPLAGIQPDFTPTSRTRARGDAPVLITERWARRPRLRRHSNAWRYLWSRGLSEDVLFAAARCDVVREGPHAPPGSLTAIPTASLSTSMFAARLIKAR
jgi:hypothetical protein